MFRNKYNSPDLRTGLGHPFVDPLMLHDQIMDIDPPPMEPGIESALEDAANALEDKVEDLAKDFAKDIKDTYNNVFGWIFDKLGEGIDFTVTEFIELLKKIFGPVVEDYFWWILAGLIIGFIILVIVLKFLI
jgi:hypothetical protein